MSETKHSWMSEHTCKLLLLVPHDCADDGVLLAGETIHSTFGVALSLSEFGFGFASGVLLLARALPSWRASHVADGLHDSALDRMELSRCLTDKRGKVRREK